MVPVCGFHLTFASEFDAARAPSALVCLSYPGCPLPVDDAHTLATWGSPHSPLLPASPCSLYLRHSRRGELPFRFFFKAQSIFGKQPSMHMTNSDSARNDMPYSLYSGVTSISTDTLTHTHTHCALVCASECAFDDLQKVLCFHLALHTLQAGRASGISR